MAVRFRSKDRNNWRKLTEGEEFEGFCTSLNQVGGEGRLVKVTEDALQFLFSIESGTHFIVADDKYPNDPNPKKQVEVVFMGFGKPTGHARFSKNA